MAWAGAGDGLGGRPKNQSYARSVPKGKGPFGQVNLTQAGKLCLKGEVA